MQIRRVVPDLSSADPQRAAEFYTDVIGLLPAVSIEVDDVDAVHAEAVRRGLRVVHPLTDEPWGVRRFFVEDPDGHVINVLTHRGQASL
jgi:catechol 2,3-dioxygenase-like lactoylglutathione lyase family enzyme